jgi:2-iminobutanoate/2-iminopropanoate deaminase
VKKRRESKMGRVIIGAPRRKPTKNAQATRVGNLLFTVGSPFNWDTGEIVGETVEEQTKQTMENIITTLAACGSSLDNVDKIAVHIHSREAIPGMNEVYYSYFPLTTPVRCCVVVGFGTPGMMVEMEVIAHIE